MTAMRRTSQILHHPFATEVYRPAAPSPLLRLRCERQALAARIAAATPHRRTPLLREAAALEGRLADALAGSPATREQATAHYLSQGRTLLQINERTAAKSAMTKALDLVENQARRIWLQAEIARIDGDPAA
jgi:hypothetical protein